MEIMFTDALSVSYLSCEPPSMVILSLSITILCKCSINAPPTLLPVVIAVLPCLYQRHTHTQSLPLSSSCHPILQFFSHSLSCLSFLRSNLRYAAAFHAISHVKKHNNVNTLRRIWWSRRCGIFAVMQSISFCCCLCVFTKTLNREKPPEDEHAYSADAACGSGAVQFLACSGCYAAADDCWIWLNLILLAHGHSFMLLFQFIIFFTF